MAAYEFIAINGQGKKERGTLEADSNRQIRQQLREQGWLPVSVKAVSEQKVTKTSAKQLFQRSLSTTDLALITRQLATLVQAALPTEEALEAVAAQQEKTRIKNILLAIRSRVLEGYTLAQSLESYSRLFPPMYRATVAAGEHSGYLDKVLNQLADHTETRMQSVRKIQQALLYPLILMVTAIAIISFLLGYVVPDIIKVFVGTGQPLPWITSFLISSSERLQSDWPIIAVLFLALTVTGHQALKRPTIRFAFHKMILRLPLIGKLARSANTSQFASTLSILTRSGVPLVEAISIASQVINNVVIKKATEQIARDVSEGMSLNKAMRQTGYFPPMMIHMVASGEATGELDQMLERTAHSQQQELESKISLMLGLFEPMMLVVMGGMVMLIVLAILLPILNMNQLLAV